MAQTSNARGTSASSHHGRMKWKSPIMLPSFHSFSSLVLVLDHFPSRATDEHEHEDDAEIIGASAGTPTPTDPVRATTKRHCAGDDDLPFQPCVFPAYQAFRISR